MEIYIKGTIDEDAVYNFWKSTKNCRENLKINITSFGGYAECGLAIVDMISELKTKGIKIHTHCIDTASSSASLIFACGDVRTMTNNSCICIHQVRSKDLGDNVIHNELLSEQTLINKLNTRFIDIYKKNGVIVNNLYYNEDSYFKLDCIKFNIITNEDY